MQHIRIGIIYMRWGQIRGKLLKQLIQVFQSDPTPLAGHP